MAEATSAGIGVKTCPQVFSYVKTVFNRWCAYFVTLLGLLVTEHGPIRYLQNICTASDLVPHIHKRGKGTRKHYPHWNNHQYWNGLIEDMRWNILLLAVVNMRIPKNMLRMKKGLFIWYTVLLCIKMLIKRKDSVILSTQPNSINLLHFIINVYTNFIMIDYSSYIHYLVHLDN